MAKKVLKSKFKAVADKLMNETFEDFKKPLTLRKATPPATYGGATTYATEAHEAIRESYKASEIDGQAIQKGDFKLILEFAKWTTITPRSDNVDAIFNGATIDIVSVETDAADATYILQCRAK